MKDGNYTEIYWEWIDDDVKILIHWCLIWNKYNHYLY